MMTRLLWLFFTVGLFGSVCSFECGTFEYDAETGGYIKSPNFPDPYPDGPYNCTYIITHRNGGRVLLEFTDYLTHRLYSFNYYCRENFYLIERDEYGTDTVIQGPCRDMDGYYESSTVALVVRIEIRERNLFGIPFFKAKFSGVPRRQPYADGYGFVHNYHSSLYLSSRGYDSLVSNHTYLKMMVMRAAPNHQIAYTMLPFDNETGETVLEVRDGMTSESKLIQRLTKLVTPVTIFSETEFLYTSFSMEYYKASTSFSFVSIITRSGPCPTGYYKCASNDICIGESAVCDGFNHCGDNSDEEHPTLNCSRQITSCEDPSPCYNDGYCHELYREVYCSCEQGYGGEWCEFKIEGCPFECLNGTCSEYHCHCPVGKYGDFCELTYECYPPCQNGGTCNYRYCLCPVDYYGLSCEQGNTGIYDDKGRGRNFSILSVALPVLMLIIAIATCCAFVIRRNQRRQRASGSFSRPNAIPIGAQFTDNPPAYHVAVDSRNGDNTINRNNRLGLDEPDGYCDEAPPTYESVTASQQTPKPYSDEHPEPVTASPENHVSVRNENIELVTASSPTDDLFHDQNQESVTTPLQTRASFSDENSDSYSNHGDDTAVITGLEMDNSLPDGNQESGQQITVL